MDILYLLIPISLVLVGLIAVVLLWAVKHGQFEDMEGPAHRILLDDDSPVIPDNDKEGSKESKRNE